MLRIGFRARRLSPENAFKWRETMWSLLTISFRRTLRWSLTLPKARTRLGQTRAWGSRSLEPHRREPERISAPPILRLRTLTFARHSNLSQRRLGKKTLWERWRKTEPSWLDGSSAPAKLWGCWSIPREASTRKRACLPGCPVGCVVLIAFLEV